MGNSETPKVEALVKRFIEKVTPCLEERGILSGREFSYNTQLDLYLAGTFQFAHTQIDVCRDCKGDAYMYSFQGAEGSPYEGAHGTDNVFYWGWDTMDEVMDLYLGGFFGSPHDPRHVKNQKRINEAFYQFQKTGNPTISMDEFGEFKPWPHITYIGNPTAYSKDVMNDHAPELFSEELTALEELKYEYVKEVKSPVDYSKRHHLKRYL